MNNSHYNRPALRRSPLQGSGRASRSAPAERGEMAGHAGPLGQMDGQETRQGQSEETDTPLSSI